MELAAARARALGVHGLLAGLDDRFALLSHGLRGLPARQRTLRAVIDWSWALLDAPEQAVLRRLSVHAGAASTDAARAVCADGEVTAGQVPQLLARLVDRSLVVLAEGPDGGHRLLESVRDYARQRLREAGEDDATRARHGAHHRQLLLRAEPLLRGAAQARWLARLDAAEAELRPAVEDASARGQIVPALRAARAFAWYGVLRGRTADAARLLDAGLAAARELPAGPGEQLERATEVALASAWHTGLALRGGGVPAASGDPSPHAAAVALDAPAVVARDPGGRAAALWFLAAAQMGAGDVATGEDLAGRALAAAEGAGDKWVTAAALSVRARHALARGDLAGARADAGRAALLFDGLGDRWGLAQTVFPRAALHEITGDHQRAARLHREGLALAEELGWWTEAAKRLCALGRLALLAGDRAGSRERHARARRIAREQGNLPLEVDARIGLGMTARRDGDLEEAQAHMDAVLDFFRASGYLPGTALALAELGFTAEQLGRPEQARDLHAEGLATARALGDARAVALALEGLAGAAAAGGAAGRAAELLGAAHAARAGAGAPLPAAERYDVDRVWARCLAALGPGAAATAFARGEAHDPKRLPAALPADA
ncbi:ATP-binding protein [Streptomyces kanasensis]|uniref:ATP-binding protein n=1 Tax=Streptomyces kanasensis TaxID=936756 RepID=UPI003813679D